MEFDLSGPGLIRLAIYLIISVAGFILAVKLLRFIAGVILGIVLTLVMAYLYWTRFM